MRILNTFIATFLFIVVYLTACAPTTTPTLAPTPITIQLKWVNQAQFAGFYVAADKGYYTEENINIKFSPGGTGINIIDEITSGRAQFGITDADQIILARDAGKPVKAIATIYRRNPFVVVTLPESGITTPADLIGKTINIGGTDGLVEFKAMMSKLKLDINKVNIIPYTYDLQPFYTGQIDATPAIAAGSLIGILKQRPDANLIWAEDYGIHFYSDTLFTTDQMIDENPDLVLRFLRATLKGQQYAIENPDEAAQISLHYAKDPTLAVQHDMMIASIPFINTGEDHIGWMKPEIWSGMEQTLNEQGLLAAPLDISQVYTMQFLQEIYK
jgi:NitT/TauT family transport system substrate-binding protein